MVLASFNEWETFSFMTSDKPTRESDLVIKVVKDGINPTTEVHYKDFTQTDFRDTLYLNLASVSFGGHS